VIAVQTVAAAMACLVGGAAEGMAAITLASPFGEHMVLPQGVRLRIWGAGCPGGDSVGLSIAGQRAVARSDWAGSWQVELPPLKAGGPYQLLISAGGGAMVPTSAANSRGGVELNDVLVGDVWLTAGASAVPAAGPGPQWVRVFRVSGQRGQWVTAAQDTRLPGSLHGEAKSPVGLIDAASPPPSAFAVRGVIWSAAGKPPAAFAGPVYASMSREGSAIRLRFRPREGGLSLNGEYGFQIAGADRKFVPASARIEGEELVVSSPDVPDPVAVRYGYSGGPPSVLCDRAGLLAAPFRTDAWQ
jgi:hypothetical protein